MSLAGAAARARDCDAEHAAEGDVDAGALVRLLGERVTKAVLQRAAHEKQAAVRQIELPLALPLLFTGIRVAAVTVVATAPIAAIAGGGGLGDIIVNQASYQLAGVLGASLCVMLLSTLVFVGLLGMQIAVTPRGLRRTSVVGDPLRKELQ